MTKIEVIIETSIFTKYIKQLMSDDQYRELQEALVNRPDLGDIIRVIYYWVVDENHIRMLYVYPKGKQGNLTSEQLNTLKTIVERW